MRKPRHIFLLLLLTTCFFSKIKAQCGMFFVPDYIYNCATGTAVVTFTINGGAAPYTFTFVGVGNTTIAAGTATGNTVTATGFTQGSYTVYVTTTPSCTASQNIIISNPYNAGLIIITPTMVTCPGGNNGAASAAASGGSLTPPYSYTWTNGTFSQTASNLTAGIYSVTLQDVSGCAITKSVQITEPPAINSIFSSTLTACNGGTLNSAITTTGGNSPYSYTVNGVGIPANMATGLSAGVNTIITRDAFGCLKTNTILIGQPVQPTIAFNVTQPLCKNSANGSVTSTVTNAPLAYSYTWQPGGINTSSLGGIPAGNYTLTVKDGNSCITKSVVVVAPAVNISSTVNTNPENCSASDGAFTINITGGNFPYTYSTVGVGSYTNNFLNNLSSGSYTTIITDGNNCKDSIKFVIGNLSTVSVSIVSFTPVLCYGNCTGMVQVNVQNGILPITYSASGTPTTSSSLITNICAGAITVKVIDNIGCPATTTINFPVPPVFSFSATTPAPICIGKTFSLQASANGGSGGYNYVWNPGNVTGQTVSLTSSATTVYSLNVYDSNGCTLAPYQVTVTVNAPLSINLNSSNSGICPGTTAQISPTVAGGDGVYNYNWSPGNLTSSSIFVQNVIVPYYTLTVNDACGSPTVVKVITVNLFPVIVPTFSIPANSGCEPFCTTFTNTTPKSSAAIWNYGDKPFEQQGNVTSYCYDKAGMYNLRLTVTDSNSCKTAYTYTNFINVLKKPVVSFVTEPAVITLNNSDNVLLRNSTTNGSNYIWHADGNYLAQTENIHYTFPDTGCVVFRLIASNQNNCRDTLYRSVCVIEGFNFYMPNCFTPNNDGKNDTFFPKGTGWSRDNYIFEIFNRWGKRIFKTNDIYEGWDGVTKGAHDAQNTYYWHVSVMDDQNIPHEMKGFVLLLKGDK